MSSNSSFIKTMRTNANTINIKLVSLLLIYIYKHYFRITLSLENPMKAIERMKTSWNDDSLR